MSILELSKAAGVSVATVSRVINGKPNVSADKTEAVRRAMKKTGYTPSEEGNVGRPRRMPPGLRTGIIAVLFPDTHSQALRTTLSGRLLHGVEQALQRRSLTMVVSGLTPSGGLPPCIERGQVDGVIIRGTSEFEGVAELSRRAGCVWMLVPLNQSAAPVDIAMEDNAAIGTLAAHWLLGRGHRRLAFLNLIPRHPSFRARRLFFQDEAAEVDAHVVTLSAEPPIFDPRPTAAATALVERFLAESPRPTGIFVPGADLEVMRIYQALESRGVIVGRDVDLISCNNDAAWLAAVGEGLPNIDIDPEGIGRAAVDLLLWRLRHPTETPRRLVIPPRLIEPAPRGGTGGPPVIAPKDMGEPREPPMPQGV